MFSFRLNKKGEWPTDLRYSFSLLCVFLIGFDRVCSLFGGQETIRDYIAFPKNNQGRDVMIDSPSYIDQEQMDELFLESKAERKE